MFVLTEDQQLLADAAAELVTAEAPVSRFRAMRDAGTTHDAELWEQLVELGWSAIPFAEDHGGLGMGLAEMCLVTEALGTQLAAHPLLSTLMAGRLAPGCGVIEGKIVGVAWQEGRPHPSRDPSRITTRFDGRLTGEKVAVLDGSAASAFLVSAMVDGELGLFFVQAGDATVTPLTRMDHRDCADVRFDGAPATRIDGGLAQLERALDEATIALSAEMIGGMQRALDQSIEYLKTRKQFGVPIGSFQALQHRAVDAFIAIELARSCVMAAARDPRPSMASLAKARSGDAFLAVTKEAIQLHGGIGMTDEHDIGMYLKRARVAAWTLGDGAWHRDRWARIREY